MRRPTICTEKGCRAILPEPPTTGASGYARVPAGRNKDGSQRYRAICYACASKREARFMIRTGRTCLYLTPDKDRPGSWTVADWPGGLVFPARGVRVKPRGHRTLAGYTRRIDAWFTGPDGRTWVAVVRGDMDLARCKRLAS